jgi:translocation and assembly module TamB
MARPVPRTALWVAAGFLVALLALVIVVAILTRTPFGVERTGRFVVNQLQQRVAGDLRVGRVTSAGLGGTAVLHDVAFDDPTGRPFVRADSIRLAYSWRTFLGGSFVFRRLTLYQPTLHLERMPGDTAWNYQYAIQDTAAAPPDADAPRNLVLLEDVRVHGGTVYIRVPFQPEPPVQPADTARLILEPAPRGGGMLRVIRLEELEARLPRVVWETPAEPGQLFRVADLSGRFYMWTDPAVVRAFRGDIAVRDSVISIDAPILRLPESRGALVGQIVLSEADDRYDLRVDLQTMTFRDLQWLYPPLPQEGGGALTFHMRTVERGNTLWLAENARLQAPGTRLAGSFGIVTGDTLYFTNVNLRAAPLNLQLIEDLLPLELPLEGLLVGTVEVEGPISSLRSSGELSLAGAGGRDSRGSVRWSGTVDARSPLWIRELRAEVRDLDLALARVFAPELDLAGAVSGSLRASGGAGGVRFTGNMEHRQPGRTTSVVSGDGRYLVVAGTPTIDARFEAGPLALEALSTIPGLEALTGGARGTVDVAGTLADLRVTGDLSAPAGRLALTGRFDLVAPAPRYHAEGSFTGLDLAAFAPAAPASALEGNFVVLGAGDPEAGEGSLRLELTGGAWGAVAVRSGSASLDWRGGLATLDSVRVRTAVGSADVRGTFGLAAGRHGRLTIAADVDDLEALRPHLFREQGRALDMEQPRLGGHATLRGGIHGGVHAFRATGRLTAAALALGEHGVERAAVDLELAGFGTDSLAFRIGGDAHGVLVNGNTYDAVALDLGYRFPDGRLRLDATAPGDRAWRLAGDFTREGTAFDARIGQFEYRAGAARWALAAPAPLRVGPNHLELGELRLARAGVAGALVGSGTLAWGAAAPPDNRLAFRVDLSQVPLRELLLLGRATADAGGVLAGYVDIRGTPARPVLEAELRVDGFRAGDLSLPVVDGRWSYADHLLVGRFSGRRGPRRIVSVEGRIPVDLAFARVPQRALDLPLGLAIRLDSLPAAAVTGLVDGFADVRGWFDGTILVAGTSRDPAPSGSFTLRGGAASLPDLGVRYEDVQGTFRLLGGNTLAVDGRLRTPGGAATVTGSIGLAELTDPRFDLDLRATSFLAARRRDVELTGSGDLQLRGRYTAPVISGRLRVDQGVLNLDEIWRQYLVVELGGPLLFNVVDTSQVALRKLLPASATPFLRNLVVRDAYVNVARDAWLRSRDMNVEVAGDLAVAFSRRDEDLRMTGTLNAVRGYYQLYGRRFAVRRGTVEFVGTPGVDPNLDIAASYRVRTHQGEPLEIQAVVEGTLLTPRVALRSDAEPPISESDLASYLIFGRPTYALASPESRALGLATARDLGTGLVKPSAFGWAATGLEAVAENLGIDYVAITAPEANTGPAPEGSALGSFLAGTQVELGRYLGDNLFLAFTQQISAAAYQKPGARLEWRFLPTWTAEAFLEDRFARTPSPGLEQTFEARKIGGFFLYREWGF